MEKKLSLSTEHLMLCSITSKQESTRFEFTFFHLNLLRQTSLSVAFLLAPIKYEMKKKLIKMRGKVEQQDDFSQVNKKFYRVLFSYFLTVF